MAPSAFYPMSAVSGLDAGAPHTSSGSGMQWLYILAILVLVTSIGLTTIFVIRNVLTTDRDLKSKRKSMQSNQFEDKKTKSTFDETRARDRSMVAQLSPPPPAYLPPARALVREPVPFQSESPTPSGFKLDLPSTVPVSYNPATRTQTHSEIDKEQLAKLLSMTGSPTRIYGAQCRVMGEYVQVGVAALVGASAMAKSESVDLEAGLYENSEDDGDIEVSIKTIGDDVCAKDRGDEDGIVAACIIASDTDTTTAYGQVLIDDESVSSAVVNVVDVKTLGNVMCAVGRNEGDGIVAARIISSDADTTTAYGQVPTNDESVSSAVVNAADIPPSVSEAIAFFDSFEHEAESSDVISFNGSDDVEAREASELFNERVEFEEGILGEHEDAAGGSVRVNIVASEVVAEITEARSEGVETKEEEKTMKIASTVVQIGAKETVGVDAEEGIASRDVQQDRLVHETKNVNLGRVITIRSFPSQRISDVRVSEFVGLGHLYTFEPSSLSGSGSSSRPEKRVLPPSAPTKPTAVTPPVAFAARSTHSLGLGLARPPTFVCRNMIGVIMENTSRSLADAESGASKGDPKMNKFRRAFYSVTNTVSTKKKKKRKVKATGKENENVG